MAKKAIGRQIAAAQAEQDQLRAALDGASERMGQSGAALAAACREAFQQARQTFAEAASDSEFNRLVELAVGPMVLLPGGTVAQKEATASEDGRLARTVAGGRYDTERAIISAVLWASTHGAVRLPA